MTLHGTGIGGAINLLLAFGGFTAIALLVLGLVREIRHGKIGFAHNDECPKGPEPKQKRCCSVNHLGNPDPANAAAEQPATKMAAPGKPGEWKFCPLCANALVMGDADGKQRLKCTACNFVHWDNPKGVAVVLVPHVNGGVVLVERDVEPKKGFWALPGGFIDRGEDPWAAAVREVKEETGLDVVIDKMFGPFNNEAKNQHLFFFHAKPVDQEPKQGSDAAKAEVFAPDAIPQNIAFPSHAEAIARWKAEQAEARKAA